MLAILHKCIVACLRDLHIALYGYIHNHYCWLFVVLSSRVTANAVSCLKRDIKGFVGELQSKGIAFSEVWFIKQCF